MKRKLIFTTTLITGLTLTVPAVSGNGNNGFYDYAKVVRVRPITRTVQVDHPRQRCWERPVSRSPAHGSYTPEIFGVIIGAAVGNQFGKGKGKKLATAAGAALGGSIARDAKHRRDRYVGTETNCDVEHDYYGEEQVVGYRVKYRYRGRTYRTRTDRHPGRQLRVWVSLTPAE